MDSGVSAVSVVALPRQEGDGEGRVDSVVPWCAAERNRCRPRDGAELKLNALFLTSSTFSPVEGPVSGLD